MARYPDGSAAGAGKSSAVVLGDAAAVADKLAVILPASWGADRVAPYVEFLYALTKSTAADLARYARFPKQNPHRAQKDANRMIQCGEHPFLVARLASDVKVETDPETNLETVRWLNPPQWRLTGNKLEQAHPANPESYTRRVLGPLSSMEIWDRSSGGFKPGWGPGETPTNPACG